MGKNTDLHGNVLTVVRHQNAGWNAAAIAADESLCAAVLVICRMELSEKYCDPSDWSSLVIAFGSEKQLRREIDSFDLS